MIPTLDGHFRDELVNGYHMHIYMEDSIHHMGPPHQYAQKYIHIDICKEIMIFILFGSIHTLSIVLIRSGLIRIVLT